MSYLHRQFLLAAAMSMLVGCSSLRSVPKERFASDVNAQTFKRMGPHERTVSTDSPLAQVYFDQAFTWYYAFNHDEAIRSFSRAAELDSDCAMAWWGVALSHGPNYNDPDMTEARNTASWDALQKAKAQIVNTTPIERALIEALAFRYANPAPEDRASLDKAYADAMAEVWQAYPDDPDVGTLYAEAMMVRMPWQLYDLKFNPAVDTSKIVSVLDHVLVLDPDNPGANHLYVHAIEPSSRPDRALAAAGRLDDLVPASGHLLHMPSHIYVKTGKWNRAIVQNVKAMRADATYRELSPDQGIQHLYMVHNAHMLAYAAMMSGREREAMAAARAMWQDIPEPALREVGPIFDRWMSSVYDVQKRFGRWDAILAEPAPPEYLPVTTAIWRAHRAIAYAAKKDFANARSEWDAFRKVKDSIPEDHESDMDLTHRLLEVSDQFIAGEIALQRGDWREAAEHLRRAAAVEDTLSYGEPPQWLQPVRHTLGAVYLASGDYTDAERAYREDLVKWPGNGWSLYGLSRALEGQGRVGEARRVMQQYHQAWKRADEQTTTSCKCIPKT